MKALKNVSKDILHPLQVETPVVRCTLRYTYGYMLFNLMLNFDIKSVSKIFKNFSFIKNLKKSWRLLISEHEKHICIYNKYIDLCYIDGLSAILLELVCFNCVCL